MATDLANSAEAEYTAVVQIPDTGEALNSAAIINMILPLINRTEYLNAGLSTEDWKGAQVYDDFLGFNFDSSGGLLHTSQNTWAYLTSGSAVQSLANGPADATGTVGALQVLVSGADTGQWRIHTGFDSLSFRHLRRVDIRVKFEAAVVSGRQFECGVFQNSGITARNPSGAEDSITLLYDDDEGSGWYLRTVSAGAESIVAIPDSTMTDDTYAHVTLWHDGAGAVTAGFNGGTTVAAASNVPGLDETATFGAKCGSPASGSRDFSIDCMRVQLATPGRLINA